MMFGGSYDKSLWLILSFDIENRNRLVKFINSIPNEIYRRLHSNCQYGKFKGNDFIYTFRIEDGKLSIAVGYISENEYDDIFILTLNSFEELDNLGSFDSKSVGSIAYKSNINGSVYCDKVKYNFMKTPFFSGILSVSSAKSILGTRFNNIDLDMVPDGYGISDMCSTEEITNLRLVREKKNSR